MFYGISLRVTVILETYMKNMTPTMLDNFSCDNNLYLIYFDKVLSLLYLMIRFCLCFINSKEDHKDKDKLVSISFLNKSTFTMLRFFVLVLITGLSNQCCFPPEWEANENIVSATKESGKITPIITKVRTVILLAIFFFM